MDEKFWMVQGKGPATVRHLSREAAVTEARRILETDSRGNGGQVYVLEAVAVVRQPRPAIEVITLEMHPMVCEACGQTKEATRPRSKKCRACDKAAR